MSFPNGHVPCSKTTKWIAFWKTQKIPTSKSAVAKLARKKFVTVRIERFLMIT